MLDSLTRHFIADEHRCWFDDMYLPDYTLSRIWDWFIPHIRSGALAGESFEESKAGLTEIEASKAYQEYHVPIEKYIAPCTGDCPSTRICHS